MSCNEPLVDYCDCSFCSRCARVITNIKARSLNSLLMETISSRLTQSLQSIYIYLSFDVHLFLKI